MIGKIDETASFLRFSFFKSDMFLLLLLFFIAHIVLTRKPFSRVVQEISKKYCKVAPRSTSPYYKVKWLSSYFHAHIHAVMMKLLILTEAFFEYVNHDMVELSMRAKF